MSEICRFEDRWYRLALPELSEPRTLVLALHGLGQSVGVRSVFRGLHFPSLSSLEEFGDSVQWGTAFPAGNWRNWERTDLPFLASLMPHLRSEHRLERIILAGFSDGAWLCHWLLREHSELFEGALIHSGQFPEELRGRVNARNRVPVLLAAGQQEGPVITADFRAAAEQYAREGHAVHTWSGPGGHEWDVGVNGWMHHIFESIRSSVQSGTCEEANTRPGDTV